MSVAGQTITISSLTLAGAGTATITYGSTAGGGSGATATSSTGAQTWQAQEKSTSGGVLANLGASPSITVYAADGSGTLTSGTSVVSASQTGRTITFTYTAATGGISNGTVTLVVPSGWTAPSTTGANAGFTTSSAGSVSVAGQTITVSSLTLAGGGTATITYGSTASGGPGATATSTTGAQTWQVQEKSTSGGALANLGSSPSITVYAADGSGTLTSGTSLVSASQTGRTITFTYTAAAGGINNGSVTLVVPAGWSAPSTTGANAGYTTASSGTVSVAAQTITVSSLTIAGGSTFTITYGSTASGGPGATATSTTGAQTWQAQAKSTSAGSLANLGSSPSITVYAADGSGTLTAGTSVVSASQTGTHGHLHVHRGDRRDQQRLRHARRPGRLERTLDDGCERGLHDVQLRHPLRRRADHHRLVADNRRRLDLHDHLRRHGRRRAGRNRTVVDRHADLAGAGQVHLRRVACQPRLLT